MKTLYHNSKLVAVRGRIAALHCVALAMTGGRLIFCHFFVHIAPEPPFAALGRGDDGVLRGVEVLGSVLVFGLVTAADVAAVLAYAQVHPCVAEGDAFGANVLGGRFEAGEGTEVLAGFGHEVKVRKLGK